MPIDDIGGRVGNEMPGKRNILVTNRWVRLYKRTMGTHILFCQHSPKNAA